MTVESIRGGKEEGLDFFLTVVSKKKNWLVEERSKGREQQLFRDSSPSFGQKKGHFCRGATAFCAPRFANQRLPGVERHRELRIDVRFLTWRAMVAASQGGRAAVEKKRFLPPFVDELFFFF